MGWAWRSPATGRRSTPPIAAGRLVFGIFAALAEFEWELIRERTVAGLSRPRGPADAKGGRVTLYRYVGPGQLREQVLGS